MQAWIEVGSLTLWRVCSLSWSIFYWQTEMCFHSGQSWGDVDQLWSKHRLGTSKQLQAWAKKLSPLLRSLAWLQHMQRGFWTGAGCVLLLHLEGVSLSAKSTLVTPKSLSWQITEPLLAGRRMRVRTQLVWVSNSVVRNNSQLLLSSQI